MIKRRNFIKAGLAILTALPLVNSGSDEVRSQEPDRTFEDQEPFGFDPPHRKCKKYEKAKK